MRVRYGLFLLTLGLLSAVYGPTVTAAEQEPSRGRAETPSQSLRAALEALRAEGLNLVFSSALVKPRFRVDAQAGVTRPLHERAAMLLKPFGLTLQRTGPDVWYVVRSELERAGNTPLALDDGIPAPVIEQLRVTSSRYRLVRDVHEQQRLDRELDTIPSIGRDLLRAVNQLPGQASVGISARSHIRGGDSNEVLYLIDGVQVIEPFHLGDFHALVTAVNPGVVDAINVYNAGFPAALGSRLSGVVDMELVEPVQPFEARVDVNLLSAAAHAQGNTGAARWLISARRSTLDHLLDQVEQDYGEPRFQDGLLRLAWENAATELTLGLMYGSDALALEDDSAAESARADYHNSASWIRARHAVTERIEANVDASYTRVDNVRSGTLNAPFDAVGQLREKRDFTVTKINLGLRWRPSQRWRFHGGVEGQSQQGDFEVDIDSRYGGLAEPLQPTDRLLRDVRAQRDGTLLSAYFSAQQQLTDSWSVEYGGRYELQDIDPVHDNQFSPRVQITFLPDTNLRAFLNVGRYTQHQNLYELQLDDGLLELDEPQVADQVSLGVDWSLTREVHLRTEGYWREVDQPWARFENLYNRWVLLPELHADRVGLSPDRARTYGGELTLDYRPSEDLRWSVSLALARAEERFGGTWRPRPWEQRRSARASVDWRRGAWRYGLSVGYHAGWPTTSRLIEPLNGFGRLYDERLPEYVSLDLHVARRFDYGRSTVEVYLDLTNAGGAENVGGYRYGMDAGGVTRDERALLPEVPVVGVSWSW